jgi:tetratricopeptide (TPR) repeat protein
MMHFPAEASRVSLQKTYKPNGPYPPIGFLPFSDHNLGNGDTFGLYWPVGRESQPPLVAEIWHDNWALVPHFSSLGRFLEATANLEEESGYVPSPSLSHDPESPRSCLEGAKEKLGQQQLDEAVGFLETAVAVLPEYTEAHALLCLQYRRLKREDDAIRAAVKAIISPPCFGGRPVQLLRWFSTLTSCPAEINANPIWQHRQELKLRFGGEKLNDDYSILYAAIEYYVSEHMAAEAVTLNQTYGELMVRETVSFQERHGFVLADFVPTQAKLGASLLGKSRATWD